MQRQTGFTRFSRPVVQPEPTTRDSMRVRARAHGPEYVGVTNGGTAQ